MARHLWKQASDCLSQLRAEQAELVSHLHLSDAQPHTWEDPTTYHAARAEKLLKKVAELRENGLLQHEILHHASRMCAWQICSPDTLARIVCHSWPAFPDIIGILEAIACCLDTPPGL